MFSFFKRKKEVANDTQAPVHVNSNAINEQKEERKQKQMKVKKTSILLDSVYCGLFKAYDYTSVLVAGVEYAKPDFSKIDVAKNVDLIAEPENEYDKNAIRIEYNGNKLGYIPRGWIQDMVLDFWKRDETVVGMVKLVDEENCKIEIELAFYKDASWLESNKNCLKTKLTKTNKKDSCDTPRYENLETVSEGDPVTLEYDDEAESYTVYDDCYNEIGEVSKSVSEKIMLSDDSDEDIIAMIDEVGENNNGNCTATIKVYISK